MSADRIGLARVLGWVLLYAGTLGIGLEVQKPPSAWGWLGLIALLMAGLGLRVLFWTYRPRKMPRPASRR